MGDVSDWFRVVGAATKGDRRLNGTDNGNLQQSRNGLLNVLLTCIQLRAPNWAISLLNVTHYMQVSTNGTVATTPLQIDDTSQGWRLCPGYPTYLPTQPVGLLSRCIGLSLHLPVSHVTAVY